VFYAQVSHVDIKESILNGASRIGAALQTVSLVGIQNLLTELEESGAQRFGHVG
jgi:hypothetical protein